MELSLIHIYGRMVDLMLAYRKAEKEDVQPVIPAVS